MARRHRGSGGDEGAALVEMALVLPFLLLLLMGVFATARAWQVHNVLDHAVREAARHGATLEEFNDDESLAVSIVEGVAESELTAASVPTSTLQWCIEKDSEPCDADPIPDTSQVGVQITYPDYVLNFLFFSFDVDLQATAYSRYEHDD